MNVLTPKQYCVMKQWFSSEYRICKLFWREFDALLSNRPKGSRGSNQKNCRWQVRVVPRWGLVCRGGRVTKPVFNGCVSSWKCTRPFGVILSWIFENKLLLGIGCSGWIARLMRWNETRTYWLGFGVWFVAAWPFQAEDFSPLAWGITNWTVKPCPFSYSGNSGLKEIA